MLKSEQRQFADVAQQKSGLLNYQRGACRRIFCLLGREFEHTGARARFVELGALVSNPTDANFEILCLKSSPLLGLFQTLSYAGEFANLSD